LSLPIVFFALSVGAQTNPVALTKFAEARPAAQSQTPQNLAGDRAARQPDLEQLREECVQNRRMICGKVLKILPDGIVVDSGYVDLMRDPLDKSWLIPGIVVAERDSTLLESHQPDAVCVGQVFLTDLPKPPPGRKLLVFDYVVIEAFPAGQSTYTSVGDLSRTVRKYSTKLATAVRWMRGQQVAEMAKETAPAK
jgi:hypothetical protein